MFLFVCTFAFLGEHSEVHPVLGEKVACATVFPCTCMCTFVHTIISNRIQRLGIPGTCPGTLFCLVEQTSSRGHGIPTVCDMWPLRGADSLYDKNPNSPGNGEGREEVPYEQRYPPLRQLHCDFGDFNNGICHVMK